jgi:Terminase small subunit
VSLHWRKQLFVAEYVAHPELNASEVAIRCGFEPKYAKNRAYELLRNPEVKAAIGHAQQQILAKVELTAEDVIRDILATRQRCVEAGDGAWQTQGRLKCDELLGKYLDMWQEKVEVSFAGALSDRLKKARAQVGRSVELAPKLLPEMVELEPVAKVEEAVRETHRVEPSMTEQEDWVQKYC